jgi:hypothetical protein
LKEKETALRKKNTAKLLFFFLLFLDRIFFKETVQEDCNDLAEWLNLLYPGVDVSAENFMDRLQTGEHLLRVSSRDYIAL